MLFGCVTVMYWGSNKDWRCSPVSVCSWNTIVDQEVTSFWALKHFVLKYPKVVHKVPNILFCIFITMIWEILFWAWSCVLDIHALKIMNSLFTYYFKKFWFKIVIPNCHRYLTALKQNALNSVRIYILIRYFKFSSRF